MAIRAARFGTGDVITVQKAVMTYQRKRPFSTTGAAELHLVTCTGRKLNNGHFRSQNLVVTAVPIS